MPKYDGTGPNGKGPVSGRGSGYCAIPLNTTEQELEFLKNQRQALKYQLKQVETRIRHIENKSVQKEIAR